MSAAAGAGVCGRLGSGAEGVEEVGDGEVRFEGVAQGDLAVDDVAVSASLFGDL